MAFDPSPVPDPNITTGSVFWGQVIGVWKSIKNSIHVYRHNLILVAMIVVVYFLYMELTRLRGHLYA